MCVLARTCVCVSPCMHAPVGTRSCLALFCDALWSQGDKASVLALAERKQRREVSILARVSSFDRIPALIPFRGKPYLCAAELRLV